MRIFLKLHNRIASACIVLCSLVLTVAAIARSPGMVDGKNKDKATIIEVRSSDGTVSKIRFPAGSTSTITAALIEPSSRLVDGEPDSVRASGQVKISVRLPSGEESVIRASEIVLRKVPAPPINARYRDELEKMLMSDQSLRGLGKETADGGMDWKAVDWKKQGAIDAANLERLEAIVGDIGWPIPALVGDTASKGAMLILLHAPLDAQIKLLRAVELVASEDGVEKADLAMLTDRIKVGQGKPQSYGTQFHLTDGRPSTFPIIDVCNVDHRRWEVGLPKIDRRTVNPSMDACE